MARRRQLTSLTCSAHQRRTGSILSTGSEPSSLRGRKKGGAAESCLGISGFSGEVKASAQFSSSVCDLVRFVRPVLRQSCDAFGQEPDLRGGHRRTVTLRGNVHDSDDPAARCLAADAVTGLFVGAIADRYRRHTQPWCGTHPRPWAISATAWILRANGLAQAGGDHTRAIGQTSRLVLVFGHRCT